MSLALGRRPLAAAAGAALVGGALAQRMLSRRRRALHDTTPGWALHVGAFCIPKAPSAASRFRNALGPAADCASRPCADCGEDAVVSVETSSHTVVAIADGVGGWRKRGIDPSRFPRALLAELRTAAETLFSKDNEIQSESDSTSSLSKAAAILGRIVHPGTNAAAAVLCEAYARLQAKATGSATTDKPFGSSTACVVTLSRTDSGVLHAANLGDSGFVVLRPDNDSNLHIVAQSSAQQHRFNAPFQLALRPPDCKPSDDPASASASTVSVRSGDVIVLASDGMWDNLHIKDVLQIASSALCTRAHRRESDTGHPFQSCPSARRAAFTIARSLAMSAQSASRRGPEYDSPFSIEARRHGLSGEDVSGGKPDDITVAVAIVAQHT